MASPPRSPVGARRRQQQRRRAAAPEDDLLESSVAALNLDEPPVAPPSLLSAAVSLLGLAALVYLPAALFRADGSARWFALVRGVADAGCASSSWLPSDLWNPSGGRLSFECADYDGVDAAGPLEDGSDAARVVFVYLVLAVHVGVFVLLNGFCGILYWGQWPAVEAYKVPKNQPWPWKSPHPRVRESFWRLCRSSAAYLTVNYLISYINSFSSYRQLRAVRPGLFSVGPMPDAWELTLHLPVCVLVEDALFYWSHRLLHTRWLYKMVHKVHHRHAHTVSFASETASPIEYVIGNLLPFVMGPVVCGAHLYTTCLWLFLRLFKTAQAHSGYSFDALPLAYMPYSNSVDAHDFHHAASGGSGEGGSYGSFFRVWDSLCNTDAQFVAHQARLAAKHAKGAKRS